MNLRSTLLARFRPSPPLPPEYWQTLFHSMIMFLGQSAMGVVDLYFCKKLGPHATAVVGTGTSLFSWFMIAGFGVVLAFEFLIPNAVGEKDEKRARSLFNTGIVLILILSVVSTLGLWMGVRLSGPLGINPEIIPDFKNFCTLLALSYLPTFLVPLLRVELQARGHPSDATHAYLIGNLLNILLNYAWVWGRLGFDSYSTNGSATASVVARFVILFYLVYRTYRVRLKHPFAEKIPYFNFEIAKKIVNMGVPISLHLLFEMGAFIFVGMLSARFATAQTAAHTIAITLASFTFMIPLGVSSAAALTISKALGENLFQRARDLGQHSIRFGGFLAVLSSLSYIVARPLLIDFYTEDPVTAQILSGLLVIVAIFQFADAMQVILSGCIRGLGQTKIQAVANFFGHWFIGIPIGLYCAYPLQMDIRGLWLGLCIGLFAVAIGLGYRWNKSIRQLTRYPVTF
jgi:MATE family multidrug resistance protein